MKRLFVSGALSITALALASLLAGCAADRGSNIPGTAELLAEGNGTIAAEAPHDGMAYVYDSTTSQLVYSGPVARGAKVVVDRANDQIEVDGKVVQDKTVNIADNHRIFFDPQANVVHTY